MGARQQQTLQMPEFNKTLAQSIISDAIEKQKETAQSLQSRGQDWIRTAEQSQSDLNRIVGRSAAQALQNYERQFMTGIPAIQAEFEAKQKKGPELIGSESYQKLGESLRGSAKEYTAGMRGASEEATTRLYQALATPLAAFDTVANKPSFNKLYDPVFMSLATKPPTVQSDVDSMKGLYTYNV